MDRTTDNAIHIGIAQDASGNHGVGAAHFLLGGLKSKLDAPGELIAAGRQHFGEGEPDGDVGVMAAGVHLARRLRAILDVVLFGDGQRVDISADEQRAPVLRAGSSAVEQSDDASASDALGDFQPGFAQGCGDRCGGFVFLEG